MQNHLIFQGFSRCQKVAIPNLQKPLAFQLGAGEGSRTVMSLVV
jgi:hypothetical protein